MTKARDLASIPAGSGDFSVDSNTLFVDASTDSVGIGTSSPNLSGQDKALTIKTTNSNSLVALELEGNRDSDGNTIGIIRGDNNGNRITQINFIRGSNANDGKIRFYTTDAGTLAEAATFNESGNLVFPSGQGIDFSATGNGSGTMTSELLDDYEEGTWTPTIAVSGSGSVTIDFTYATYTKIGNAVLAEGYIDLSAVSSPSGYFTINGLPYASRTDVITRRAGSLYFANAVSANVADFIMYMNTGSTGLIVVLGDGTSQQLDSANQLKSNTDLRFGITYSVNS